MPNDPHAAADGPPLDATAISTSRDAAASHNGPFGPPAAAGEVGTLGPYRLLKQLGKGGMGAVYLAFDARLNRKVALKVMLPEFAADVAAKGRFLREARAAAQITHDHVVIVHEADERDGVPYMTMQFLQGYPLNEYLKKGRLTVRQALRVGRETALGLSAAHAIGLVHRDIKPANLWLEAPNGRVKVLDFGLAKPMHSEAELTGSGEVIGTPAYMSPEQAHGAKVDARTDLWSLGVVLYRLCTGRMPFEGPTTMAVLMALGTQEPTPVRAINPEVPEPFAELIHQLLAKDPNRRPAMATEVAARLGAADVSPRRVPLAESSNRGEPQVVYVPIHVTAVPEVSAFADLDEAEPTETNAGDERTASRSAPVRKPGFRGPLLVAGAVVALAAVAVVFALTNKGKSGSKADPPAEGVNKGVLAPAPKPTPKPAPVEDAERAAARYVLATGATVQVNGVNQNITAEADLPREAFQLTAVIFQEEQADDAALERLKGCAALVILNVRSRRVTDKGLAHLRGCTDLRDLVLEGTVATDGGLAAFQDCVSLGILVLSGPQFTDVGMAHFKNSTGLSQINLTGTSVGDATLAQLARNKNIILLHVTSSNVTDAGLAHLKNCPGISHLRLDCPKVTETGMVHLEGCHDLRVLNLEGPNVTGAWLPHFRASKNLRALNLGGAVRITDADLDTLARWPMIDDLNLTGTPVTDTMLKRLAGVSRLRILVLRGTKVTGVGVAELADALPECQIEWNGGTIGPKKKP